MKFEKATQKDINSLVELRIKYLIEDFGEIPPEQMTAISEHLPPYFTVHLNKDLFVFVCRDGSVIAGCCFLCITEKPSSPAFITGRTGTVLNVYTEPEYRNKGIAPELMQMLLEEAVALSLDYVELKSTDAGYSLYKTLGFIDVNAKYHNMKYIL